MISTMEDQMNDLIASRKKYAAHVSQAQEELQHIDDRLAELKGESKNAPKNTQ